MHKEVADQRRELQEKVADLEREGRELQEEFNRRDEADADMGGSDRRCGDPKRSSTTCFRFLDLGRAFFTLLRSLEPQTAREP